MSQAIVKVTKYHLKLVSVTALYLSRIVSGAAGKVLSVRWPQRPFVRQFDDTQTATIWGSQADVYAVAMVGGEPVSAGRGVGTNRSASSADGAAPDRSGQPAGESQKIRSKKNGAARGYTKNMSAREIVTKYLMVNPADAAMPVDLLVKKINKAARRKVGRTTVNEVQRIFRADSQRT